MRPQTSTVAISRWSPAFRLSFIIRQVRPQTTTGALSRWSPAFRLSFIPPVTENRIACWRWTCSRSRAELDLDGGLLPRARVDDHELEGWTALAHDLIESLGMKDGCAVGLDDDVAGLDSGEGRWAAGLDLGHLGRRVNVVEDRLGDGSESPPCPRGDGIGGGRRDRDLHALELEIARAKVRFTLPADTPVISCYEAGRDGFWLHRYLLSKGIQSIIVDAASIEVNRRKRRAKTDRLDAASLVVMLIRWHLGERKLWSIVQASQSRG